MDPLDRPYRQNVGVALFDAQGRVLIARRLRNDGPEIILPGCEWQMPQGGVDPNEDELAAARRELWEETAVVSAAHLGATRDWMTYDFPPYDGPWHRLCAFRGQRQRWYAFRFTGDDKEIDVTRGEGGADPEFSSWRWARLEEVPELVVPFKRAIYREVAKEFRAFAAGVPASG
ncbi:putative (di)nucleoside polyphosphate hydrolase [Rhizobiales bacterium GAS191]|jgi:putative (di)nucleoside polyphosphate hydrolase|nr:putative (di)nucleoside polyphosphate hydrolase [Rhizobiales bacterium GAS113]SEE20563.1 putative (di)nucleoside polyphosphate hydrolase [Rhizobiales bacterium GAS188]SEE36318.1 putative (di)nucleoside polyphosphate hydrolase [Rhizobiales bacterium GAS191]